MYKTALRYIRCFYSTCRERKRKECSQDRSSRRTANATIWIAVFSIVSAGVGIAQWCVLSGTLKEMRAEQRGWLAVTGVWHEREQPFVAGSPIEYVIEFKNVGKNPIKDVKWRLDNGYIPLTNQTLDMRKSNFSNEDMCKHTISITSTGVIFPDTNTRVYESGIGYIPPAIPVSSTDLNHSNVVVSRGMLDGTEAFYVRGCADYTSGNITGLTAFCFIVQRYQGKDGSPGNVTSIDCHYGNGAK